MDFKDPPSPEVETDVPRDVSASFQGIFTSPMFLLLHQKMARRLKEVHPPIPLEELQSAQDLIWPERKEPMGQVWQLEKLPLGLPILALLCWACFPHALILPVCGWCAEPLGTAVNPRKGLQACSGPLSEAVPASVGRGVALSGCRAPST